MDCWNNQQNHQQGGQGNCGGRFSGGFQGLGNQGVQGLGQCQPIMATGTKSSQESDETGKQS